LLGRHIRDGAFDHARPRSGFVAAFRELRESEIGELCVAIFRDENVRRLDVAMQNA
jgi:hypothetical protein